MTDSLFCLQYFLEIKKEIFSLPFPVKAQHTALNNHWESKNQSIAVLCWAEPNSISCLLINSVTRQQSKQQPNALNTRSVWKCQTFLFLKVSEVLKFKNLLISKITVELLALHRGIQSKLCRCFLLSCHQISFSSTDNYQFKDRMLLYVWGCWINTALSLCGLRLGNWTDGDEWCEGQHF